MGAEVDKLLKDFEILYPKIEYLIVSKMKEPGKAEKVEEGVVDVPEDKVKEILYLSRKGWNAEEISEQTGLGIDIVQSIIFDGGY